MRNRMISTLAIVAISVLWVFAAEAASAEQIAGSGACTQLTVASINVRYPEKKDGVNYWENRKDIMVHAIKEMAPDIFGLQEAYYEQNWYIQQNLPGYQWFGRDRYGMHTNEHMTIIYNTEKLELMNSGEFWLSDKPEIPASMTWGNTLPRMVNWGLFRIRSTGQQFYFYNTHFHHTADADFARTKSAKLIASRVLELPANIPVVLTGDFNTTEASQAYRALVTGENPVFQDTRLATANQIGPTGTAHGFTGRPGNRIDYIMTRGPVEVLEQAHVTYNEGGRYPSDHFPVKAVLRLCGTQN